MINVWSIDIFFEHQVVRIFYAQLHFLDRTGEPLQFDTLASNAIATALYFKAPLFAEDSVIERWGRDASRWPGGSGEVLTQPSPASPEELEGMSAFRDFIEGLDLDDFGDDGDSDEPPKEQKRLPPPA